jgi:hypothetical protein
VMSRARGPITLSAVTRKFLLGEGEMQIVMRWSAMF